MEREAQINSNNSMSCLEKWHHKQTVMSVNQDQQAWNPKRGSEEQDACKSRDSVPRSNHLLEALVMDATLQLRFS